MLTVVLPLWGSQRCELSPAAKSAPVLGMDPWGRRAGIWEPPPWWLLRRSAWGGDGVAGPRRGASTARAPVTTPLASLWARAGRAPGERCVPATLAKMRTTPPSGVAQRITHSHGTSLKVNLRNSPSSVDSSPSSVGSLSWRLPPRCPLRRLTVPSLRSH